MSEERFSSSKLDIEGAQRSSASEEKFRETYKPISEDIGLSHGESSVCGQLLSSEQAKHKPNISPYKGQTNMFFQNVVTS